MSYLIRDIKEQDNDSLKLLIPQVLAEFGAVGKGYAGADPEVQNMYKAYQISRAKYWIVELQGKVMGGGGIAPLKNAHPSICELQKMYFGAPLRGQGAGKELISMALEFAKGRGFKQCYLETLPNMKAAQALYIKFGFEFIPHRMGNTGHSSCPTFMLKNL